MFSGAKKIGRYFVKLFFSNAILRLKKFSKHFNQTINYESACFIGEDKPRRPYNLDKIIDNFFEFIS